MILSNEVYPKWYLENALRGLWGRTVPWLACWALLQTAVGPGISHRGPKAEVQVQIPLGRYL